MLPAAIRALAARPHRRRAPTLRRAALAFPADTAVIAVICDERAHPRMQGIGGFTVLTIGVLDDLASLMVRGAGA